LQTFNCCRRSNEERDISDSDIVVAVFSFLPKTVWLVRLSSHLKSLIYEVSVETEEDLLATIVATCATIQNIRVTP